MQLLSMSKSLSQSASLSRILQLLMWGEIKFVTCCKNQTLKDSWVHQVCDILRNKEKNENACFHVKEVQDQALTTALKAIAVSEGATLFPYSMSPQGLHLKRGFVVDDEHEKRYLAWSWRLIKVKEAKEQIEPNGSLNIH
ncbi:hypothetical protein KIW84_064379 [Lathyrus oleraceus]|uniref:Uncharacterized protein n=1 Tax=Pisum sativum TaxID=3888 RepID=A0A9D4WCH2_PEA|nr:hypothetical protein KIW84_064379 [Pisum sativum]